MSFNLLFPLAQLVEHQTASHWIPGSSPVADRVSFCVYTSFSQLMKNKKRPCLLQDLNQQSNDLLSDALPTELMGTTCWVKQTKDSYWNSQNSALRGRTNLYFSFEDLQRTSTLCLKESFEDLCFTFEGL